MKNRGLLTGLPLSAAILATIACLCFCGCSSSGEENPAEIPFYPVMVYDDGVYAVECTDLIVTDNGDGTEEAVFSLRVTNNSTDSMALSSVLGIRVSVEGNAGVLLPVPAGKTPVDGLIDAGSSREGWIAAQMPVDANSFTVEMAVNYLDDQWISFTISR